MIFSVAQAYLKFLFLIYSGGTGKVIFQFSKGINYTTSTAGSDEWELDLQYHHLYLIDKLYFRFCSLSS